MPALSKVKPASAAPARQTHVWFNAGGRLHRVRRGGLYHDPHRRIPRYRGGPGAGAGRKRSLPVRSGHWDACAAAAAGGERFSDPGFVRPLSALETNPWRGGGIRAHFRCGGCFAGDCRGIALQIGPGSCGPSPGSSYRGRRGRRVQRSNPHPCNASWRRHGLCPDLILQPRRYSQSAGGAICDERAEDASGQGAAIICKHGSAIGRLVTGQIASSPKAILVRFENGGRVEEVPLTEFELIEVVTL